MIENNYYSEHTSINYAVGCDDLKARTEAFGFPVFVADGADFLLFMKQRVKPSPTPAPATAPPAFCGARPLPRPFCRRPAGVSCRGRA
ncbi:MAG: hypothetical protein CM15mP74_24500 [Halieaceae bacterium]|nr:MAG: hypothetical protein CM15mP74_24500 [Halieaceae bacterium]